MTRPLLLDLFCGSGGASRGYADAGFDVIGVDINPQPHYRHIFIQADALNLPASLADSLDEFDVIHASPPCQAYSTATAWRGDPSSHPDLLQPTIDMLEATGRPYVIENVPGAPMPADLMLCGSMFGLPIRRHRLFMVRPTQAWMLPPCQHRSTDLAFEHKAERAYADAMGITWASSVAARQCIPPAYTEHIGRQLLAHLEVAA